MNRNVQDNGFKQPFGSNQPVQSGTKEMQQLPVSIPPFQRHTQHADRLPTSAGVSANINQLIDSTSNLSLHRSVPGNNEVSNNATLYGRSSELMNQRQSYQQPAERQQPSARRDDVHTNMANSTGLPLSSEQQTMFFSSPPMSSNFPNAPQTLNTPTVSSPQFPQQQQQQYRQPQLQSLPPQQLQSHPPQILQSQFSQQSQLYTQSRPPQRHQQIPGIIPNAAQSNFQESSMLSPSSGADDYREQYRRSAGWNAGAPISPIVPPALQSQVTGSSYPSAQPQAYSDYAPQSQQRKLDPDSMPNPIQVMEEDQQLRGKELFVTNKIGLLPPLVSTQCIIEDCGFASPRFVRSTIYSIPCSNDIMKQTEVPFSLVITPLATLPDGEQYPPVVQTAELGPVRCVRCKAYMNPHFRFIDAGRRFICVMCKAVTQVPSEYFQHLDQNGLRADRFERPELMYGAYEFTVTKEYCKDDVKPNVPALIFLIDVSYNNVRSGLVRLLCKNMLDIVTRHMPFTSANCRTDTNAPRMKVGFITYDNTLHFYNIKACLGQPQMMIVSDLDDVFVPLLDGFLCDPIESIDLINLLMQQIPSTFANTRCTDTILYPAVQAGLMALKAAKCAGKLLVFHSSLPSADAPGKLINREDRKLLATEKEKTVLNPQNSLYTNLATECIGAGCSVDLFIFNNTHVDLATIGQLARLTGGEVFKYTYFSEANDEERMLKDVKRHVHRDMAFDAVMRVRTSAGVRPVNFFGHLHMSNSTDVELAAIDSDKSIAVEIKHDDKLSEEDGVFVQVAFLYTSTMGERKVRIFNVAFSCCSQGAELFRNCELDTLINYWAKANVVRLLENSPRQMKESLVNQCARILANYRKLCTNSSSPGQLILPECMKLLPLYVSCLLKSDAISGGCDMTVDDRWFMMQLVSIMDIRSSVSHFYPRLIPLVNIDYSEEAIASAALPNAIRCTSNKTRSDEAYLLENGVYIFIWLGSRVPAEWTTNVFGEGLTRKDGALLLGNGTTTVAAAAAGALAAGSPVSTMASMSNDYELLKLKRFDNVHSKRIMGIIDRIQVDRRHSMKNVENRGNSWCCCSPQSAVLVILRLKLLHHVTCHIYVLTRQITVIRENEKMEVVYKHFLVEDGSSNSPLVATDSLTASSYVDFLCHVHKEIRNILS